MNQRRMRQSEIFRGEIAEIPAGAKPVHRKESGRAATILLAGFATVALASGCGDSGSGPIAGNNGLNLSTFSDTEIAGTYSDPVTTLQFASRETAPGVVAAEVGTDAAKLTINIDYNEGSVDTDGSTALFNPEEIDALRALEIELQSVISSEDDAPSVEAALGSLTSMAGEADAGERFPSVSAVADRSWVTIGCGNTCRTLYRSCGGSYYKQTGISSPNCKGRCGAGCGNARTTSSDVWSMDCAEHDYHLGPVGDCVDDISFASKAHCTYSPAQFCATNCSCADGPGC